MVKGACEKCGHVERCEDTTDMFDGDACQVEGSI